MIPLILQAVEDYGYRVFDGGHAYNLNIVGLRSSSRVSGKFDDLIACAYREKIGGPWIVRYWEATLDAGAYWLEHPMRSDGTAILKGGQYRSAYKLGIHRGYPALTQAERVTVYRDNNRDNLLDMVEGTEVSGLFGINIHKAGESSTQVGKWSAGCQVFAQASSLSELLELCTKQIEAHPSWAPRFTYTLIEV